ncbi:MAG: response regulator transcription factor [Dehalococcoidales bacterium]
MDERENPREINLKIEQFAMQAAKNKTNVAKWSLDIAILLFALLITIIILISLGINTNIVALVAISGLALVWLIGWARGKQLYKRIYHEELLYIQEKPSREVVAALMSQLTTRELQIINYVSQGYANKRIAFELGISESTVKGFISSVLSKLNASDRTQAVVIAIKHGLISVG